MFILVLCDFSSILVLKKVVFQHKILLLLKHRNIIHNQIKCSQANNMQSRAISS